MLFSGDRKQMREFFRAAWRKHRSGEALQPVEQLIAGVVAEHPEYHAYLESEDALANDFTPQDGVTNPFLHMGMHVALREQAGANRPAGFNAAYAQLAAMKGDRHEAEHRRVDCLGETLWAEQAAGRPPDEVAFMACVRRLLQIAAR